MDIKSSEQLRGRCLRILAYSLVPLTFMIDALSQAGVKQTILSVLDVFVLAGCIVVAVRWVSFVSGRVARRSSI
jgi:hypothetical protein